MRKTGYKPGAVYQSISAVAEITGESKWFLRKGCREGSIPHKKCGSDYRINLDAYLAQSKAEEMPEQKA